jgi:putative two-component system response regulator
MAKILCVDDEPDQLMLLKFALGRAGHTVITAPNGKVAVEMALTQNPELILMDLMMPIMDGATAVEELKKNDLTRDIPIFVLSAFISGDQARRAKAAGAVELISKNEIMTVLLDKVKRVIAE